MSNISIKDQNNDHKYFSILQNILSRIGLTAFERSAYWAIKECAGENGSCTKSYAKLAEMSGMSVPSLKRTLTSLCEENKILKKPLIQKTNRLTESGDWDTNEIIVVDIWIDNNDVFKKNIGQITQNPPQVRRNSPQITQNPGVGSHRPEGGITQSYNKEPINKNPYKEQQHSAVVFFDCLVKDKRLTDANRESLMKKQFSEERIKLAQEYSFKVKATKGLIQQIMWHCSLKEPPPIPKKNFWDAVREHFKNNKSYNSADCYIDQDGIAFHRGLTHLSVKFADPAAKEKFLAHIAQFKINWDYDD